MKSTPSVVSPSCDRGAGPEHGVHDARTAMLRRGFVSIPTEREKTGFVHGRRLSGHTHTRGSKSGGTIKFAACLCCSAKWFDLSSRRAGSEGHHDGHPLVAHSRPKRGHSSKTIPKSDRTPSLRRRRRWDCGGHGSRSLCQSAPCGKKRSGIFRHEAVSSTSTAFACTSSSMARVNRWSCCRHGNGTMIEDFETSGLLDMASSRRRVIAFESARPWAQHPSPWPRVDGYCTG